MRPSLQWAETLRYFQYKCETNTSDRSYERLRKELWESGREVAGLRSTRSYLQSQLGIDIHVYHRCIKNCMVFIDKDNLRRRCRFCRTSRFIGDTVAPDNEDEFFPDQHSFINRRPRATYSYLPLIPRLKLLYANAISAAKMRYPRTLNEEPWDGIRDIWDGGAMKGLKEAGYFADERTVALHFSTDGVQLYQNSTWEVWPFLVLNLNLPL